MAKNKKEKRNRLRNKFRFSIFNDTTHEELFVIRSNGIMMITSILMIIIVLISSITLLISYTPLREYIPGYPDARTRAAIVRNAIKADSLEQTIKMWDFHLNNIQKIISGEEALIPADLASAESLPDSISNEYSDSANSISDSLLREEVIRQERMNSSLSDIRIEQIEGLHFFTPVKGIVSNSFDYANNHPYTDIAAPANSVISSVLDGTVIFSAWTEETGYTIHIQHNNNLVSIYKHNSKLLKNTGDKVKAGNAIALVGSTGELSSGNHLHFELWHKGEPIDPERYIKF